MQKPLNSFFSKLYLNWQRVDKLIAGKLPQMQYISVKIIITKIQMHNYVQK